MFHGCCDQLIVNQICLALEQKLYAKSFRIVEEHHPPGLHLLMHGSVQVFEVNEAKVYRRHSGEYFGERALLDEYNVWPLQVILQNELFTYTSLRL